jgi:heme/copper-type cytochrome/quinol oxidase subunit 2
LFIIKNNNSLIETKESNELELFWTILPSIIIFTISSPSLFLLYTYEENKFPIIEFKIFGNQWYWSYEYQNSIKIERYIGAHIILRCLHTNNSLIIPTNTNIRLMITSNDVIHSWTIPSLISKIDAIPGRLNIVNLYILKSLLIKGQCSEICGVNHSFIPISLFSIHKYVKWPS